MDGVALIIPGISQGEADGRYVRRFVGTVLAADSYDQATSTVSEPVLANPSGPVMGGIPKDIAPALLGANQNGRFFRFMAIMRDANAANVEIVRFNGTPQAPTQVLLNDQIGSVTFQGWSGTQRRNVAQIVAFARENVTNAAHGGGLRLATADIGASSTAATFDIESSSGVGYLRGGRGVSRFRPNTTGQLRNPSDTATLLEWNVTGLGFFGVAPIARPTITGSRAGNAAVASIAAQLAALGLVIDGTTP